MTTPTTDAIMAMADRYAFHIPGSQHSDEARAVLLAALHEQAREGEAVAPSAILARGRFHAFKGEDGEPDDWEWFEEGTNCEHGCIDAVIVRADAITAPQPAQPSEPAQPEYFAQYEYALDFSVLVAVYRRRADQTPELIHKEALPKQIGDGQPAQPEQGERAAQKAELLKNLTQWLDGLGGAIHTYSLRGIALHGFEKGWDAALQSSQPVAQPLTDERIETAWRER